MKILKLPYYGFDHSAIDKHFEGKLTFCNEFCVWNEYKPVAVYKSKKPNTKKGHKKYMLLHVQTPRELDLEPAFSKKKSDLIARNSRRIMVRGMGAKEMKKWRYQQAVHCLNCSDVIFSMNRHDFHSCSCGKVSIDGGKDYTKLSYKPDSLYEMVKLDLITDKVIKG